MKQKDFIATIQCAKCEYANFILVQVNNKIHIICSECGYPCEFDDQIKQLKTARSELGES